MALWNRECGAAFVSELHAERARNGLYGGCGYYYSTTPLVTVPNAFPMVHELVPTLGYWQKTILEQTPWERYLQRFQEPPICDVAVISDTTRGTQPVDVLGMLGLWLLLLIFGGAWLCQNLWKCAYLGKRLHIGPPEGDECVPFPTAERPLVHDSLATGVRDSVATELRDSLAIGLQDSLATEEVQLRPLESTGTADDGATVVVETPARGGSTCGRMVNSLNPTPQNSTWL